MSVTLTTRIPEDLADAIEAISEAEQLDKGPLARRLLERVVEERRHERAFQRYAAGERTLKGLAREADMPLQQGLTERRDRRVSFLHHLPGIRLGWEERRDTRDALGGCPRRRVS